MSSSNPPQDGTGPDATSAGLPPELGDGAAETEGPGAWPEVAAGARLVAFVPDLMDRSRIRAARPEVQFLTAASALDDLAPDDVVLVDLGRPAARSRLPTCRARIIGFVAHVDHDVAEQAQRAGAAEVLARSVFFRRLRGGTGTDAGG